MKRIIGIVALGFCGSDAATCYAPTTDEWDCKTCSLCVKLTTWDPNTCLVGNQGFTCGKTVEECCGSVSMQNAYNGDPDYRNKCIASSVVVTPAPPTRPPPPVVTGKCVEAVSMNYPTTTNRDCQTACQSANGNVGSVALFSSGDCIFQGYVITNGRTDVKDSKCYNKWVYGYSQEAIDAAMNGVYEYVASPAQCQMMCQELDGCINWIWFSELVKDSEPGYEGGCALKNSTEVDEALKQSLESQSSIINDNYAWCGSEMPYMCNGGGYDCLKCQDKKRCVWISDLHVAGYKDCNPHDECDPESTPTVAPTNQPPSTTPSTVPTTTTTTTTPTTTTATTASTTSTITTTTPVPPQQRGTSGCGQHTDVLLRIGGRPKGFNLKIDN